jgi:RNA polymerase sigma-70 factor (ECF subfamily)
MSDGGSGDPRRMLENFAEHRRERFRPRRYSGSLAEPSRPPIKLGLPPQSSRIDQCGEIPTPHPAGLKIPGYRRVFLPKEGFKGILRYPGPAARFVRRMDGGATVSGAKLRILCLEIPASRIEPIVASLRQTLRSRSLSANPAASDEVLIGRIAQGDRLAMQVLFARHHVRVYRFVLRLVRNEASAEDLISEVFLDVWRQADRFEGRSAVSTWLLAIARFKALSSMRRKPDEELDDEAAGAIEDASDTPEVSLQKKDKGAVLRSCLEQLSREHREVIDLVYYHEKSVEEVAEIVGIPEATVKTRVFYARKKLSELLKAAGLDRGWP